MAKVFLARPICDRTRSNSFNLREGRFRLNETFFTTRVVKQWNRLPRKAVEAPFLEIFKVRLDGAEQPGPGEDVPACCRGVGLDDL